MITFKTRLSCLIGNDNKLLLINLLLITAFLLGGCTTKDPIATPSVDSPIESIIDGDTVKTVVNKDYKKAQAFDPNSKNYIVVGDTIVTYKEPKLHTPPTKDPDLSKLKNNDDPDLKGKPLRYVAIGGRLTAGVRDGGYFNEGILTSYPNLIARQMKLKKFEQPLFDAADYNGFGRKTRTNFNPTGGPVPKFNTSKNNLGIEGFDTGSLVSLIPKKLKVDKYQIDNWGILGANIHGMNRPFYRGETGVSGKRFGFLDNEEKGLNTTQLDIYYKLKMDIFTMEFLDIIVEASKQGGIPSFDTQRPGGTEPALLTLLKQYAKEGRKGCIANFPSVVDFPYYKSVTFEQLRLGLQGTGNIFRLDVSNENTAVIIPNSRVDSLTGAKVHVALKKAPTDVEITLIRANESVLLKQYNDYLNSFAKQTGYPVVDLQGLYEKIIKGNYVSQDGVRINNDNFFSSDGVYPTPLGQAVIANEFIKTLNSFYGLAIPLISTKEYLTVR